MEQIPFMEKSPVFSSPARCNPRVLSIRSLTLFCLAACFSLLLPLLMVSCGNTSNFKGLHIIYLAGGGEDHFFARILARGARDAAHDLELRLDVRWSDWDKDKLLMDFKEAIAEKPDGICLIGYPGEETVRPFVDEALRKGITVTTQNVDLPGLEAEYGNRGFGYVGQNVRGSGINLTREALRKSGTRPGNPVMVIGIPGVPGRGERTMGIMEELERQGIAYRLFDMTDTYTDPDKVTSTFRLIAGLITKDTLILNDENSTRFLALLREQKVDPASFYAAAFDISSENFSGLEEGYFDLLLDQQPYLQGYLPVLQCALTVRYGLSGLHILTDASLVDRSNMELVRKYMKEGVR